MSFRKKIITTYSKSLFQNLIEDEKTSSVIDFSTLVSSDDENQEKNEKERIFLSNRSLFGKELSLIRTSLVSNKQFEMFFKNPSYPEKQKKALLFALFPGFSLTMKSFLEILTERSHLSLLPEISEAYDELLFKSKKIIHLSISLAGSCKKKDGRSLFKQLKKTLLAKELIVTSSYNPMLLGGFSLEFRSLAIDSTLVNEFGLLLKEF